MSYPAQVIRIAIASPSDVEEEREVVARTIQEWNDLNSAERKLVLLPIRWETHTAPGLGERPQETVNREVVDKADLLVGIFWTRLGSDTGTHASGTLEEIDRAGADGKPVMLYFSRAKVDPSTLDLKQLGALKEYEKAVYPEGLVEHYTSTLDFRDKFARQLERKVRELQGTIDESAEKVPATGAALPEISIELSAGGALYGSSVSVQSEVIAYDKAAIPDYNPPNEEAKGSGIRGLWTTTALLDHNKDYYRQLARRVVFERTFRRIDIRLENIGGIGARDVFVELLWEDLPPGVRIITAEQFPAVPSQTFGISALHWATGQAYRAGSAPDTDRLSLDVGTLQPGRVVTEAEAFFVGASESTEVPIVALIYSERLPAPVKHHLTIRIQVTAIEASTEDLIGAAVASDHPQ